MAKEFSIERKNNKWATEWNEVARSHSLQSAISEYNSDKSRYTIEEAKAEGFLFRVKVTEVLQMVEL